MLGGEINADEVVSDTNALDTRAYGIWPAMFLVDFSYMWRYCSLKCLSASCWLLSFLRFSMFAMSKSTFVNTTIIGTVVG